MESESAVGRTLRRQQRRNYQDTSQDDEIEGKRTFSLEEKLANPVFEADSFVQMLDGNEFSLKYVQSNGFKTPILFKSTEGLDMKIPDAEFTVTDVKNFVGARRLVDVIDVNTQQPLELTLQNWVKYFTNPEREKIYNVISLEFSHTKLQDLVESPLVVRQIDWVDTVWPRNLIEEQRDSTNSMADMKYPKVKKYCLMSVGGCYTDFHIDFGGTSVWYHLMKGKKIFWLIPPTERNLQQYERWVLSGKQQDFFFGDQVEKCSRVTLVSGDTFLIPTGWIHAVYTPDDSLVFGGNFIHSYSISEQIRISQIEDNTKVPQKFRYPFYAEMMWYVAEKYVRLLTRDREERVKMGKPLTKRKKLAAKGKGKVKKEPKEEKENTEQTADSVQRRSSRVPKVPARRLQDGISSDDEPQPKRKRKGKMSTKQENSGVNGKSEAKSEINGKMPEKPEVNGKAREGSTEESEKPWELVYLTERELSGLRELIERLRTWPQAQKNIPESIENPEEVLKQLEELLDLHEDDDQELAVSGVQALFQIDPPPPTPKSPRPKAGVMMSKVGTKVGPGVRRRRTRCGQCEACTREDCGECRTCKDMKKFGGPGRMKQSCTKRACTQPNLPTCVRCIECNKLGEEENQLMECRLCAEIVHPSCIDAQPDTFRVVPDINNCWECPKCFSGQEESNDESPKQKSKKRKIKHEDSSKSAKRGTASRQPSESEESDEEVLEDSEDNESLPADSTTGTQSTRRRRDPPKHAPSPPPPPTEVSPKYVIRPGPIDPPSETLELEGGVEHVLRRSTWLHVFGFLSQEELCLCMRVCRTFNRWAMDKHFWSVIDMSRKPVTPLSLEGIVRRQPTTLNLSWTNVSCKQLLWLLDRLPRLRELYLSGTTEATVSALQHVNCPRIQVLGLSWSTGITDSLLRDLISPPAPSETRVGAEDSKGRLNDLCTLYLTGNDVTGNTLRLLAQYCPSLRKIDLSYCPKIYDEDVEVLVRPNVTSRNDSVTCKDCVTEILLSGCGKLTDACLVSLNRWPYLQRLDLRSCHKVSRSEIEKFVERRKEQLKIIDEKLVVAAS
ncbi:predicted protein [Nematostella vectensis]|uniref:[histone H3]-dimethyl-L-lysine(36) demethylase n=1 Tax=Nematostella vectensis TaxID=45351 RepID=A7S527_NEMVE|nr:predicted protein [Nematostella vectensis]|eukprot:XP_001633231.1 predicted protein [Nematostella vectensis]